MMYGCMHFGMTEENCSLPLVGEVCILLFKRCHSVLYKRKCKCIVMAFAQRRVVIKINGAFHSPVPFFVPTVTTANIQRQQLSLC